MTKIKAIINIISHKMQRFLKLFFRLDEERVSTILLLTIISFSVSMLSWFIFKKIDPGLSGIVQAGFYSTAGTAALSKFVRRR